MPDLAAMLAGLSAPAEADAAVTDVDILQFGLRFERLQAIGRITLRPREVNWKNVADNYSDGLHIEVAHPGLTRLFGRGYGIEAEAPGRLPDAQPLDMAGVANPRVQFHRLHPTRPAADPRAGKYEGDGVLLRRSQLTHTAGPVRDFLPAAYIAPKPRR